MTSCGSISLVAFKARDPGKVFVRVPNEPGRWVYTDFCVVRVPCPVCHAHVGEPCKNPYRQNDKYWAGTHMNRRHKWKRTWPKDLHHEEQPDKEPKLRIRIPAVVADA